MTIDRRSFLRSVGAGSAATLIPLVQARGHEAASVLRRLDTPDRLIAADLIRLDSNENPLGPAPEALKAITEWFGEAGRYPDLIYDGLTDGVSRYVKVPKDHLLFGSGSGEILKVATETFVTRDRPLVTAGPTFETCGNRAGELGLPVKTIPVDRALRLDLDAMSAACDGAGLVFLCNPNNPTGTLHSAAALRDAMTRMLRAAPQLMVLVDEAYHEYVDDPGYSTMIPFALAERRVIVSRTFSKAYGMAGLRLGYAIARPETLEKMEPHLVSNNVNQLVGAAAVASLKLPGYADRERRRNSEARSFAVQILTDAGYQVAPPQANFLMVDIRRDSKEFREACRVRGVAVGRPFPPLTTHARISIGTLEEMQYAMGVITQVLRT